MNLACPKCTSAEVRKLSMIYSEGLSTISAMSTGSSSGFSSSGSVGFGTHTTHTSGRQQTALSKQAAPPEKKHWILWSSAAAISGLIALGGLSHPSFWTLVFAGLTVLSVKNAISGKAYNAEVLPGLMQRWEKSFMCNRCGETFQPA